MAKKRIAIIECYDDRGTSLEKLFRKVDDSFEYSIFSIHSNKFPSLDFDGYVISGGIIRIVDIEKYPFLEKMAEIILKISKLKRPIFGICLGHQLIAYAFGGKVEEADTLEVGFDFINANEATLCKSISNQFAVFNYHSDYVSQIPDNFRITGSSKICNSHIMEHKSLPIFGVQFHIEYDTEETKEILEYAKDEIVDEGMNYDVLVENTKLYDYAISKAIVKNFLTFI
jgi:GMP synthase (glutamine-hydrolysing)